MNVSLNTHLEDFVIQQLKGGRFNNASEVVRAGLRLLEEQELQVIEMRNEIQKGLDSGKAEPWNKEAFLKEAHERADTLGSK